MSQLRIAPGVAGRPVEQLQHVHDLVTAKMRERRERLGAWAPADADSERVAGMWKALYWLDGQPCGPFTDGPATAARLAGEADNARRAARGALRSRYTQNEAVGIAQLLDYARGATDTLPGVLPDAADQPAGPAVVPGGRPAAEVAAAQAFAIAMFRHEPDGTTAKPWLRGMAAAGLWILGRHDRAPVTQTQGPVTAATLGNEMLAAGQADMPGKGDPRDPAKMYARGAYRMLVYAMGYTDEMPVQISRTVAEKILAQADPRAA